MGDTPALGWTWNLLRLWPHFKAIGFRILRHFTDSWEKEQQILQREIFQLYSKACLIMVPFKLIVTFVGNGESAFTRIQTLAKVIWDFAAVRLSTHSTRNLEQTHLIPTSKWKVWQFYSEGNLLNVLFRWTKVTSLFLKNERATIKEARSISPNLIHVLLASEFK